ncbi:MAG: bifunctional hydroxymethylpyrimidine kinase/phosphomethylpyrimidine kinase, partial [Proteobacteria bacterium]|nr:bifunctional hydroxymethylpyrimidine kinase/phosphomethylpyrimidine kinase [Pseudomonadota bacterium]
MNDIPCILTIAGSDSCGGAGIQADLKTFAMHGTYGASVITALTAQNTLGVDDIHAVPGRFVAQQLKSVLTDINIRAAKTGMLLSQTIIQAVAPFLKQKKFPLVVDPVCVSQSGHKLLEDSAVQAMVERIFPHADLLTPNLPETELFTGIRIRSSDDVDAAGKKFLAMGPKAVLIKGGHDEGSVAVTDWLVLPNQKPLPYMQPRVKTRNNHGTGCTLSAAIAAQLGLGLDVPKAVRAAQRYLNLALRSAFDVGQGAGPPNHLAPLLRERGREDTLTALDAIGYSLSLVDGLSRMLPAGLANVGVALSYAEEASDVASFSGGLVRGRSGHIEVSGCPLFSASPETAA